MPSPIVIVFEPVNSFTGPLSTQYVPVAAFLSVRVRLIVSSEKLEPEALLGVIEGLSGSGGTGVGRSTHLLGIVKSFEEPPIESPGCLSAGYLFAGVSVPSLNIALPSSKPVTSSV